MKRTLRVAVVLVATGAAAAVVAGPVGARTTITIHLVEKEQTFHFIDNPPLGGQNQPPSLGDSFVFTNELLTRSGMRAGTIRAVCNVTSGEPIFTLTCFGTLGLKGGQLAAVTTIRGEARTQRIAIVGGTGAYAGARGEVISVDRGEDSPFSDDTIGLVKP